MQFHFNEDTCHALICIETLFRFLEIAIYPNFYFYGLNCLFGQLDWLLSFVDREIKFVEEKKRMFFILRLKKAFKMHSQWSKFGFDQTVKNNIKIF